MIHNSGSFGPNDVPINMGAPVNMTQISNPMNISNNVNHLAKMPQQSPQAPAPHYSMPDYSSFGHPPLNMGHSMSPFANYHHLNVQQSYGHPNPTMTHQNSLNNVQNGMLPMNLNIQRDQVPTLTNYQSIESKPSELNDPQYRENYSRKMPINIPQIHTKAFHKHIGMDDNFPQYNSLHENPFYSHDLSKTPERTLLDNNRRKSLENTVKLIENILINNTSKDKLKNVQSDVQSTNCNVNKLFNSTNSNKCKSNVQDLNKIPSDAKLDLSIHKDPLRTDPLANTVDDETKNDENAKMKLQSEIHCEPLKRSLLQSKVEPTKQETKMDTDSELHCKDEIDHSVVRIKVEVEQVAMWTDVDNLQPFVWDCNATDKNKLEDDAVIVEGEHNLGEAISAALNGNNSNSTVYYECCHCGLLFRNSKRFLIHTKWHSFGLTNEKRQELARQKEMRKNMKKEAKIIERLNSKEVKEKSLEGETHPCKDCDKVFKLKSSLKNHRQRYHPTRVRECKICGVTVVGWLALREHLNTHTGNAGYQCNLCPKRFKYSHSLAKHKDTHLEKTHSCGQCDKKFGSQALVRMHAKCHERAARGATFRCTYCGKGFFESYNLQVHERTHRNERPFLCDICNTSYGTNSSLKRHLKVSHSAAKPFACATCRRSFATAATRARHAARAHAAAAHACPACPAQYRARRELQRHRRAAHPGGTAKGAAGKGDGGQE